jgi:beta-glucosidase
LRAAFGAENVGYAKGCHILEKRQSGAPVFPGDSGKTLQDSPVSQDVSLIPAAVALARKSDVALVFVGDLAGLFQSGTVGEGSDTDSLQLPGVQQQLLERVLATGTPTVVIMTGGRPYCLNGLEDQLAGFLMAFAPGQEGGRAIADILGGRQDPSGRLVISAPKSAGAAPIYYNHKLKSGGTPIAFSFGARYPFGYGQSWTRFTYKRFHIVDAPVAVENGEVVAQIDVTNSGSMPGYEVVQVYIRDIVASLVRPVHELKAFQRLHLEPGETATLTFHIPTDMLNFTDRHNQRVVEPGEFEVQIGASSEDIRARGRIMAVGERYVLPRLWRMESHCLVKRH